MMSLETGLMENPLKLTFRTTNDGLTVRFRFALRQSVKIVALGKISGSIVARGEKIGGHIYSVVWWAENKRYESWLYEHELEG